MTDPIPATQVHVEQPKVPACDLWAVAWFQNNEWYAKIYTEKPEPEKYGKAIIPECMRRGANHPSALHPGYMPKGENHHNAKLTNERVLFIRKCYANGVRASALAERFGVSFSNIGMIVRGKTWKSAGGPLLTHRVHNRLDCPPCSDL